MPKPTDSFSQYSFQNASSSTARAKVNALKIEDGERLTPTNSRSSPAVPARDRQLLTYLGIRADALAHQRHVPPSWAYPAPVF
jgi:hypothetical protein